MSTDELLSEWNHLSIQVDNAIKTSDWQKLDELTVQTTKLLDQMVRIDVDLPQRVLAR